MKAPRISGRLAGLCLFLLGLTLLLIRWLTYNEPFERDLTTYAVIAHEMLGGRALYSDLWDIKPPGVYMLYAAAELIAGYGKNSLFLIGSGAAIVTTLGVYRAVLEATEDVMAALWAGFFWVLVCSDIDLLANQPNTEVFLNAAFIWGLALFIRAKRQALENKWLLLGAGCIWGAASLVKQVAFVAPLLLGVYLAFAVREVPLKRRLGGIASLILPTFVVWAMTFAYFALTGRLGIFIFSIVDFGRIYVAESAKVTAGISWSTRLFPPLLFFLAPLFLLVWAGLVVCRRQLSWQWGLLGLCMVATQIAIFLPGQFSPHYYQLWLPLLCWAVGFVVAQWREWGPRPKALPWLCGVAALLLTFSQWPKWRLSPDEVSIRKYSPIFVKQFAMAPRLGALLKPNQSLYEFGFDSAFYFATKRRPPVGVLCLGGPTMQLPVWFQDRIVADLKREKPELVLADLLFPNSHITDYIRENYVGLPDSDKGDQFLLMAPKGGELEERLKGSSQRWP